MRDRLTARILLFDPAGRLLLMKGRPAPDARPAVWFTIGGGAQPGESVRDAAVREALEETGFADVALGPVVWRRRAELTVDGGAVLRLDEHYFLGRCGGGEPSRAGWEPQEHSLIEDIRWWTLADIAAAEDVIYPLDLAALLPDVLAGRLPAKPLRIR